MEFTIRLRAEQLDRAFDQMGARALPAVARALNRAAVSTRVVLARNIAQDIGLKVGVVRDQIIVDQARPVADQRLRARLMTTGSQIPLMDMDPQGPKIPSRGKGRGISVRWGSGRKRYEHAFFAKLKSSKVSVFMRKGAKRLPIAIAHGPSIPKVFNKYAPDALVRGEESLLKNLASELRFAQSQAG